MDAEWLATVRQRFHAAGWAARPPSSPALFVWNLSLRRLELPGWTCERVRQIPTFDQRRFALRAEAPERADELQVEMPVISQGLWRTPAHSGVLLKADLFECASREQTVEILLRLLGEFESPIIAQKNEAPGDLAFGGRGEGLLLFTRGNLVCLCRNAERPTASVMPIAAALDRAAAGSSAGARRQLVAAAPHARDADDQRGEVEVSLLDAAAARRADGVTRRFLAPDGEIVLKGDSIVYLGPAASARRLEIEEEL
jgi:hypothetical protein